ncbi:MAG: GNAT family N-acetyltransferase [Caldimicrobium sp.]
MFEKKHITFPKNYVYKSYVQGKQNQKFKEFIYRNLKEFSYSPKIIIELGVGDGTLAETIARALQPEIFYIVDLNDFFLKVSEKKTKTKQVIPIKKELTEIEPQDFEKPPEMVFTSNTLHWLPFNEKDDSWLKCAKRIYEILTEGGFFFVHQGLKWTYFPLYDLAKELFERKYGTKINLSDYLYYPLRREAVENFKQVGFKVVSTEDFYEFEGFSASYSKDELYKSFSVAGLNVFKCQIKDKREQKKFVKDFLLLCKTIKPPSFSHRGFFCLRKPLKEVKFKIIPPGNMSEKEYRALTNFLEEVSGEFIPPLNVRTPDDMDLRFSETLIDSSSENFSTKKSSVEIYAEVLAKKYWNIFAYTELFSEEKTPSGIISFTIKNSYSYPGRKSVYISTIAVRKKYRFLSIAERLLGFVIDLVKDSAEFKNAKISVIETRTWSTNQASKKLFKKAGFSNTLVLQNHRGEGIDTEYYCYILT